MAKQNEKEEIAMRIKAIKDMLYRHANVTQEAKDTVFKNLHEHIPDVISFFKSFPDNAIKKSN